MKKQRKNKMEYPERRLIPRIKDNQSSIEEYLNYALEGSSKEVKDAAKASILRYLIRCIYRQDGHTNRVGIPALSEKCSYKEGYILSSTSSYIFDMINEKISDENEEIVESFEIKDEKPIFGIYSIADYVLKSKYWDNLVSKIRKGCQKESLRFKTCLKLYNALINALIKDMNYENIDIPEFFRCPKKMEENFFTNEHEAFVDGRGFLEFAKDRSKYMRYPKIVEKFFNNDSYISFLEKIKKSMTESEVEFTKILGLVEHLSCLHSIIYKFVKANSKETEYWGDWDAVEIIKKKLDKLRVRFTIKISAGREIKSKIEEDSTYKNDFYQIYQNPNDIITLENSLKSANKEDNLEIEPYMHQFNDTIKFIQAEIERCTSKYRYRNRNKNK